ncbi:MAG: hypothetical protein AAB427_15950 [Chloroflexota bacterium]
MRVAIKFGGVGGPPLADGLPQALRDDDGTGAAAFDLAGVLALALGADAVGARFFPREEEGFEMAEGFSIGSRISGSLDIQRQRRIIAV